MDVGVDTIRHVMSVCCIEPNPGIVGVRLGIVGSNLCLQRPM